PRLVRLLQSCRLILGPQHHWRHHKSPHQVNYCITTGWCDSILGPIRFWTSLEWVISKLTGLKPRPDEPDPAAPLAVPATPHAELPESVSVPDRPLTPS